MEPKPNRGKKTQSYVPTIDDFAIKPKSPIQTQLHAMHLEIKSQNQYESFPEFSPVAYSQVVKSTP